MLLEYMRSILRYLPTLSQSSALLVYITKVKVEPENKTISISPLIVKYPNGDYDGDEFNATLLLDYFIADKAKTFEPHFNVLDGSKPYTMSNLVTLLSPANSILSEALDDKSEDADNDTIVSRLNFVSF